MHRVINTFGWVGCTCKTGMNTQKIMTWFSVYIFYFKIPSDVKTIDVLPFILFYYYLGGPNVTILVLISVGT